MVSGNSHVFPPARQERQQQPLQQPSRGIPTVGSDEEDGSGPLSETFFGGDSAVVEERLQSENVEMPMFSQSEGPQQSAPTAVVLAAAAPAAEAVTGTSVFPAVSSKGVAEAPTSSASAASAVVPAAAPATGGTVFPTALVGGAARVPSSANETAALTAAPSTGYTTAPHTSVERVATKLTLEAGSSSEICSEMGTSTHPFDPGTMFPLEVRYYNRSWPKHGSNRNSSSSSNSSGNGNSSSSNDTTSNHDSWLKATCVGALLRPFDPGKRCRRSARRVKAVLGLDLPFDRGRAWRRMQHRG